MVKKRSSSKQKSLSDGGSKHFCIILCRERFKTPDKSAKKQEFLSISYECARWDYYCKENNHARGEFAIDINLEEEITARKEYNLDNMSRRK